MSIWTTEITLSGLWRGPRRGTAVWRVLGRAAGMFAAAALVCAVVLLVLGALMFCALAAWSDPLIFICCCATVGIIAWGLCHMEKRRGSPPPPDDRYDGDIGVRVPVVPKPPVRVAKAEEEPTRRFG